MEQRHDIIPTAGKNRELTHRAVRVGAEAVYEGHLILVNRDHPVRSPLQADKLSDLGDYPAIRVRDPGMQLENTALRRLDELLRACGGSQDIVAVSGYRTREEQEAIYDASMRENGPAYTASYVALPDRSEHQTGLAIDVGLGGGELDFIAPDFPDSGASLAFKRLAAEYGFIQRYRAGKEAITGIACEPWHFRYVGDPHAKMMEREGLCLEEYVERLRDYRFEGPRLTFEDDRQIAEIYYVRAGGGEFVEVPIADCDYYRLSGDNAGGLIVTASRGKRRRSIVC